MEELERLVAQTISSRSLKVPKGKLNVLAWSKGLQQLCTGMMYMFNKPHFLETSRSGMLKQNFRSATSTTSCPDISWWCRKKVRNTTVKEWMNPEAGRLNRLLAGIPGGRLEGVCLPNRGYAKSEEEYVNLNSLPNFHESIPPFTRNVKKFE